MNDEVTRKLGLILEQLKISDDEIQKMTDNGEINIERLGEILEETNAVLEKISVTAIIKDESDV